MQKMILVLVLLLAPTLVLADPTEVTTPDGTEVLTIIGSDTDTFIQTGNLPGKQTADTHIADTADPHNSVDDTVYGISWDGDTSKAASKNALYDKIESISGGGTGDVVGPASATSDGIALFDGTTGKLIKSSAAVGTAAYTASTDYATAAQGATADSAVQTETDPIVGAVSGIIEADGLGNISAATADVDYLTPTGDGSGLSGVVTSESDPNALLTAGTNNVKDTHVDWGTGDGQVDASDVPTTAVAGQTEVAGALSSLNTNKTTSILTLTATAANNFTVGTIGYIISAGTVTLADASAYATASPMLLMATETINGGASGDFVVVGPVTITTHGYALGSPLFVSETAGDITTTAPTTSGAIVRKTGFAYDANTVYFLPDSTTIEVQ